MSGSSSSAFDLLIELVWLRKSCLAVDECQVFLQGAVERHTKTRKEGREAENEAFRIGLCACRRHDQLKPCASFHEDISPPGSLFVFECQDDLISVFRAGSFRGDILPNPHMLVVGNVVVARVG